MQAAPLNAFSGENTAGPDIFQTVSALMQRGIEEGVAPAMVLLVARDGQVLYFRAFGERTARDDLGNRAVSTDTVFDVAALTNVVVTTTLIMKLVESGKVRIDDRVSRYLQGFGVMGKSSITVGQLLSHCSGFVHWLPFFEELIKANAGARMGVITSRGAKDHIINAILRAQLKYEPGSKQVYSDIGFMLLGHLVEVMTGMPLDRAAFRMIFQPLGMKSSSFVDLSMIKRRGIHPVLDIIAPTEECPWRRRVLCGEVHDDNAWAMGGVAGHSGLFMSAYDLHLFTREVIAAFRNQSTFLKRETLQQFWRRPFEESHDSWRFGWDSPGRDNGMADSKLSPDAIGICGFTGCSFWLEPQRGIEILLLSNRVHPSRSNKKILAFRPEIHDAVLDALK